MFTFSSTRNPRMGIMLLALVYLICGVHSNHEGDDPNSVRMTQRDLFNYLLNNYTNLLPIRSVMSPLVVTVNFELIQLKGLDGKSQVLSTVGQLNLHWVDDTLSWENKFRFRNIHAVVLPATDVWRPVIGIRNSATDTVNNDFIKSFPVTVTRHGHVIWAISGSFDTSCDLDMIKFPFDTQECSIEVGNLAHNTRAVILENASAIIGQQFYMPSKEFDITMTKVEAVNITFASEGSENQISVLRFHMRLKRKSVYYVMSILVPMYLIAMLSTISFLIPVEAGEKFSFSITILLSFTIFMLLLYDITPQTDGMPVLAIYLTASVCICGCSLVFTLISQRMYHIHPIRPMPNWMRRIAFSGLACLFTPRSFQVKEPEKTAVVHPSVEVDLSTTAKGSPAPEPTAPTEVKFVSDPIERAVAAGMLEALRMITSKMAEDKQESQLRAEWREAADLMEKFFFLIFFLVQLAMLIYPFLV